MTTPGMVGIFIEGAECSPVRLSVNGSDGVASAAIKVGVETEIDARLIPVLETADGIKWRRIGDVGEVIAEPATPSGFDPSTILSGKVADVAAAIESLSADELAAAREAEDAGKKCAGVLNAIDAAIAALN